ncbi:MAG: TetR/AcrR family transcriptional regulator [Actinomycetota bacterium]
MPRISRAERERNRIKLVAAFAAQIERDDGRAPTVSSVSAEADVARSAFYNYFTNIEELFRSYIDDAVTALAAQISTALDPIDDPTARLVRFAELALAAFTTQGAAFNAAIDLGVDRSLAGSEDLTPIQRQLIEILHDGATRGRFAPTTADPLVAEMILRAIGTHQRRLALGHADPDRIRDMTTGFVLNAVGADRS